jgi:cyanophycinase
MLALAEKENAHILVIPQASERRDAGEGSARAWKDHAIGSVTILDLSDPKAAVRQVKEADVIWIGGGSQLRLMRALEKTGVPEAIRARHRGGAVVGGTSAGAAVMSGRMISGDAELETLRRGTTQFHAGLALWPEAVVDQHFLRRRRFNRLLSAVLDRPELIGVGIDEVTAVIVSGDRFEVLGRSGVVVIDARHATGEKSEKGATAAVSDVRLHVLREGMTFDVKTGTVRATR